MLSEEFQDIYNDTISGTKKIWKKDYKYMLPFYYVRKIYEVKVSA